MKKLKELKLEKTERSTVTISGSELLERLVTINKDCTDPDVTNRPNRDVKKSEVKELAMEILKDPMHIYKKYRSLIVNGDTLHILDGQHTYYAIKYATELGNKLKIDLKLSKIPVRVELFYGDNITSKNSDGTINLQETIALEEVFIRNLNQMRKNWCDGDNIKAGLQSANLNYKKNFIRLEEIKNYIIEVLGKCKKEGYYSVADIILKGKSAKTERRSSRFIVTKNEVVRCKNIIDLTKEIQNIIVPMGSNLTVFGRVKNRNALLKGIREFYLSHQEELSTKDGRYKNNLLENLRLLQPGEKEFEVIINYDEETTKSDVSDVLEYCLYKNQKE